MRDSLGFMASRDVDKSVQIFVNSSKSSEWVQFDQMARSRKEEINNFGFKKLNADGIFC
jgi:hypothetical protein